VYLAHLRCIFDSGSYLAVDSVRQAQPPSLPSLSPLPLFLLLLDEAEGAIDADQALQGSQLQFLSVRTSVYKREDV
jgi:hypothetical protein